MLVARLYLKRHPHLAGTIASRLGASRPRPPEPPRPPPAPLRINLVGAAPPGGSGQGGQGPTVASCPNALPTVVVAVAPGKPNAPPNMRLLAALRDMLRGFRLRVELLGTPAALTPTHSLWCRSAPLPCGLHELPPSTGALDLPALTEPLLAVAPCLDDVLLLDSALPLPPLFLRQLQRLTRPGKVTCLAAPRTLHAPAPSAPSPYAPCPALAYRLPRAFLWQTRHVRGEVPALAAERGLLAPPVALVRA